MQHKPDMPFPELFPTPRKGRVAALGDRAVATMFEAEVDGQLTVAEEPGPEVKPSGGKDARNKAKSKSKGTTDANTHRK
jgi:hypothetical protein